MRQSDQEFEEKMPFAMLRSCLKPAPDMVCCSEADLLQELLHTCLKPATELVPAASASVSGSRPVWNHLLRQVATLTAAISAAKSHGIQDLTSG